MSDPLIRHWDPKGEYEGAVLKIYPHWCLEVSWMQHTLGSFIIYSRRESVRYMSQMNEGEMHSLPHVMEDIECALRRNDLFRPDHFNYLQLGNPNRLLHLHGIPRYKDLRFFGNQPWSDDTWVGLPQLATIRFDHELIDMLVRELKPLLPE